MEKTFDFNQVPFEWTLCYVSECSRKDECLRYQVCQQAPESLTTNRCVLPTVLNKDTCPHFKPIHIVKAAVGFVHLFDEVKAKHRAKMHSELYEHLGGGGSYYRYRKGTRLLMPEQQEWIRNMFRRYGYTEEVVFDDYRNVYRFI